MGAFSPWAPLMLSPVFTIAVGLVMLLVPKTAWPKNPAKKTSPRTQRANDGIAQDNDEYSHEDIDDPVPNINAPDDNSDDTSPNDIWQQVRTVGCLATFRTLFRAQLSEASTVFRALLHRRSVVVLLLLVFMLAAPPWAEGLRADVCVQYVNKRYHKSIGKGAEALTQVVMGGLLPLVVSCWLSCRSSSSSSSSSPSSHLLSGAQTKPQRSAAITITPISPFTRDIPPRPALRALSSPAGLSPACTPRPTRSSCPPWPSSPWAAPACCRLCRSLITNFTTTTTTPAAQTSSLFALVGAVETLGGIPRGIGAGLAVQHGNEARRRRGRSEGDVVWPAVCVSQGLRTRVVDGAAVREAAASSSRRRPKHAASPSP